VGDFSRATQLSVKMLRHYHRIGLLEPAEVDPTSGYRRYRAEQIPTAQVIRRFRDLDMPLEHIRAVLTASEPADRSDLIAAHLAQLEQGLARTQGAVASLRRLLQEPPVSIPVQHRRVEATPAAAITAVVDLDDLLPWYQGALGELYATLAAQNVATAGPAGGTFSNEIFSDERGEATIFVPSHTPPRHTGRVAPLTVPATELAMVVHAGSHDEIDLAYGSLGAHVAKHELAVEGPIREYYLVGRHDTPDEAAWRTEIGWPVFDTGAAS
jgi:DNA-binding transcriptional MerR regulator